MKVIVPFTDGPGRPDPNRPTLPPTVCAPWCLDADGHPHAVHQAEQICRSYPHRIDATEGGGRTDDYDTASTSNSPSNPGTFGCVDSPGSLVFQVERQPGQPATIVAGIQLLDSEFFVRFSIPEFANVLTYGHVALAQARSA